jgi:transcriptional regulator with XRE-family HTH domain
MPRDNDAIDKRIGRNIRFHRTQQGLSLAELGEAIGVTFQQIQKYESGSNRIAASRLYKVSRALRVAVESFFEERFPTPTRTMRSTSGK